MMAVEKGDVYYNIEDDELFMVVKILDDVDKILDTKGALVVYEGGGVEDYTVETIEQEFVIADKGRWNPHKKAEEKIKELKRW